MTVLGKSNISFQHLVNLLRKLTKGGGGGDVQVKKAPSKKTKAIPQARHCCWQ